MAIEITETKQYIEISETDETIEIVEENPTIILVHPYLPVTLGSDADTIMDIADQRLTLHNQSANLVLAGPASGDPAKPSFRSLVKADIPASLDSLILLNLSANNLVGSDGNRKLVSATITGVGSIRDDMGLEPDARPTFNGLDLTDSLLIQDASGGTAIAVHTSDSGTIAYFGGATRALRFGADSTEANIGSVDHEVATHQPLGINGSTITLRISGADALGISASKDVSVVAGSLTVSGGFGCNSKTAQTAYASGGVLDAYSTGGFGLDSDAHMQAMFNLVVAIRAALVANGIMS